MTTITPKHLAPFAAAFDAAVRDGSIPLQEAMDFGYRIENTVLEARAKVLASQRRLAPTTTRAKGSTTLTPKGNPPHAPE